MIPLTVFLIASKLFALTALLSTSIASAEMSSTPSVTAKSLMTEVWTTPAISSMSLGMMSVGGFVDMERREADCRYVIARRRSPWEVLMRAEITVSDTGTFSAFAISVRRAEVDVGSRGLKRNLEHRDARGSMILRPYLRKHTSM